MKISKNNPHVCNLHLIFFFIIIIFAFTTCGNPGDTFNTQQQGTITISFDDARSIFAWPQPGNPGVLEQLRFNVRFSDGPAADKEISGTHNSLSTTLAVGSWKVQVDAIYEGLPFAVSPSVPVTVVAGQSNRVSVTMEPTDTIFYTVSTTKDWEDVCSAIERGGNGRKYAIFIENSIVAQGFSGWGDNTFGDAYDIEVNIYGKGNTISLLVGSTGSLLVISDIYESYSRVGGQTVKIHDLHLKGHAENDSSLVWVNSNFYMLGSSTVSGNRHNPVNGFGGEGGGVSVLEGNFVMQDYAEVHGNTASSGGGVFVRMGEFTMKGNAKVYKNTASYGGGVSLAGSSSFDTTFIMQDYAEVNDNGGDGTEQGGGVYMTGGENVFFTMKGNATVSGNNTVTSSSGMGGGVYVYTGAFDMQENASISRNKANRGGGVYVGKHDNLKATFEMQGNSIISGNEANRGGGVYVEGTDFGDDPSNGTFHLVSGIVVGIRDYQGWSANVVPPPFMNVNYGASLYVNGLAVTIQFGNDLILPDANRTNRNIDETITGEGKQPNP